MTRLPLLSFKSPQQPFPEQECYRLWDVYQMPEHIRAHSIKVALFASRLARRALHCEPELDLRVEDVCACALLHDIAKYYTLLYGGSHAQIGAAWLVAETGRRDLAQGVIHHVYWPWEIADSEVCSLPLLVMYADKRTMHNGFVTLHDRFKDLLGRYGVNTYARLRIAMAHQQVLELENALAARLRMDLNAYTPDSGGLVK